MKQIPDLEELTKQSEEDLMLFDTTIEIQGVSSELKSRLKYYN